MIGSKVLNFSAVPKEYLLNSQLNQRTTTRQTTKQSNN